jgi:uncharacterized protein (DUF1810 family)
VENDGLSISPCVTMDGVSDPYDLQRFVTAQEQTYESAVAELRRGRKTSHWMWFVFPQVQGLGRSTMAQRFAIGGLDEARAYLDHPVLGRRLRACADVLLEHAAAEAAAGRRPDAAAVLGPIDAVKLRSSMTLFAEAGDADDPFRQVLDTYFAGEPDGATLDRLGRG